jgi:hypothetical protein
MGNPFKKPKAPKMPVIETPPPAPLPEPVAPVLEADNETLTKARKKKLVSATQRSGRASTILSTGEEMLGG